jgi:hypothetical protein
MLSEEDFRQFCLNDWVLRIGELCLGITQTVVIFQ